MLNTKYVRSSITGGAFITKKARPSVALIILFVILLLLYFFAGTIVELVSSWSGYGSFTYNYVQGSESIVSVKYDLPQDFADVMAVTQTTGWTATLEGKILSLTGGTLNPGGSVTINYRLKEYIPGGTRSVTATSRTTSGAENSNRVDILVPDVFLLSLAGLLYENAIWLLVLALMVLIAIIVLFILAKRKEKTDASHGGGGDPTKPESSHGGGGVPT